MFEKIMLSTIIIFFCTKTATSQPENLATEQELKIWIDADKADTRAKTNDIVYSISATVSDSDKERFEKWIKDVLYSALYKSDNPMKKAQLKATRWLEPLNANADSTWTYCWIMDPAIPKTIYDIPLFLQQEYGEEEGKKYFEEYQSMVKENVIALKQTGL